MGYDMMYSVEDKMYDLGETGDIILDTGNCIYIYYRMRGKDGVELVDPRGLGTTYRETQHRTRDCSRG